jgi:hypothetical protein
MRRSNGRGGFLPEVKDARLRRGEADDEQEEGSVDDGAIDEARKSPEGRRLLTAAARELTQRKEKSKLAKRKAENIAGLRQH